MLHEAEGGKDHDGHFERHDAFQNTRFVIPIGQLRRPTGK